MRKAFMAMLVLAVLVSGSVFARSTYYATGDQVFSFRGGVDFPAFISFVNDSDRGTVTFADTHMKLGGYASISYQGYISEYFALGGELGYAFNYSQSSLLLTTVPITAKLTYYPIQKRKFDLAASLNLGVSFVRYNGGKYITPYAQATIQPTFFFTESWGIGIESGLMASAELYGKNNNKYKSSAICGLLPVALTVAYRH
ncbi:MAG: hypothetical protein MJ057_02245 [Sphaerochaetaceae bacterium]|nr:hypothetical protein [Sphaerochaetaceae bacterium]